MREMKHPLTGAIYGVDPSSGLLRIEDTQGRVGFYTPQGEWRSGEQVGADPTFCLWVGGPQVEAKYDKPFKAV